MRVWLIAHPKNWEPDTSHARISLKCLHEWEEDVGQPVSCSSEAACYRIPCCLPDSRFSTPSILHTNGETDMEEIEDMELCGSVTVSPMDAVVLPDPQAAKPKPCVILPIDEVISRCRKRKLSEVAAPEAQEEEVTVVRDKKKKKSKR